MDLSASRSVPFFERGDLFLDRYRIYSLLGKGGFGQVYYAFDRERQREVAVKISRRASLYQEGHLLSGISHQNVPHAYDFGETWEEWFLIMQYIRGRTLYDLLEDAQDEGGALPVEQVYEIGIQLCGILADLHEQRPPIIFRDLKPQNIIITGKGKVYLVDFGLACIDPRWVPLPREQALFGTPAYIAPEVVSQQYISPAMDIYALGKTLYQLLTGTLPHPCTCAFSPCTCGSAPLIKLRGPLGSLVMQLLERDVRRRPADADALRVLLQELLTRREAEVFETPQTLLGRLKAHFDSRSPMF